MKENLSGLAPERCCNCLKKTLVLIKCSCSKITCLKCRMPETHICSFDFQKKGKEHLQSQNPIITSDKIDKI